MKQFGRILALIIVFGGLGVTQASAQAPSQMISVSPLGVVFGVYNLEFERAVTSNATLAVGGTYWSHGESVADDYGSAEGSVSYVSGDAKLRYYPGTALDGFSFGALVGFTSLGASARACTSMDGCEGGSGRVGALSTGLELDYTFLLGENDNFGVALGLGAKKLFPFADVSTTLAYPMGRLSIGYAF